MSIEVQIPLTLEVDPKLAGRPMGDAISDAVMSAVGGALSEMDRELIAPKGGYAWPLFHAPQIEWDAQSSAQAPFWQRHVEAEITRGLKAAIAASPNSALDPLSQAPEVMPESPYEPFDARRLNANGEYMLQSYDGDVPSPDVPVSLERFRENREWHATHTLGLWMFDGSNSALERAMASFLKEQPDGRVRTGITSALYLGRQSNGQYYYEIAVLRVDGVSETNVNVSVLRRFTPGQAPENFNITEDNVSGSRPSATSHFHVFKKEAVSNVADLQQKAMQRILSGHGISLTPSDGEPEENARARDVVRRYMSRWAQQAPNHSGFIGELHIDSAEYLCTLPEQCFSGNRLSGLIVFRVMERPSEGDGEGGGGSGGAGAQGDGSGGGGTGNQNGTGGQGQGTGQGVGDGDADVDGAGGGGGGQERRSLLGEHDPNADPDGPTRFYPTNPNGEAVEIDLGPFEGEPHVDELGAPGDSIKRMIKRIAFMLEMPEGKYAGSFCIAAAQMIGIRAAAVANYSEGSSQGTTVVTGETGNLGSVHMPAEHSPAIRVMRYIANVVPELTSLQHYMIDVYNIDSIERLITGRHAGDATSWGLSFYKTYTPWMKESVSQHFIRTCQIKMLELLRHSEKHIDARLNNIDTYYRMVRSQILGMMVTEAKLRELLALLTRREADAGGLSANISEAYDSWRDARHVFSMTLSDHILNVSNLNNFSSTGSARVERVQGEFRVIDENGRMWSRSELESAIATQHGTAASIDPLIHQFRDIPDVVHTFQENPTMARWYLEQLLREMKQKNLESQNRAKDDNMFAFRAGKIREDLPNRTIPYTDLALQGVHLLAHESVGDAFRGARAYALGVQYAMDVELGRQGLILFAETVSVIALAVVCPPAAAALGAVYAGMHYDTASDIADLYGGLIDPELILNRAEVEFDLFMAEFEIALSIIPEAGSLIRGATTAVRTVGRRGARAGIRALSTRARRELLVSIGRAAKAGYAKTLVTQVLMDRGLTLVLPHVLGPVMREVNHAISVHAGQMPPPSAPGTPGAAPSAGGTGGGGTPGGQAGDATSPDELVTEVVRESEHQLVERLREYQEGVRDETLPDADEAP